LYSEVARLQLKCAVQQEAEEYLDLQAPPADKQHDVGDVIDSQIEHNRLAVQEHPQHPDVHYRLGLLLRQRGHLQEAIGEFESAVRINPSYTKALIKLGLALYEIGRLEDATRTLQQALDLHPDYIDLHYRL